jgi:hypothetical protein
MQGSSRLQSADQRILGLETDLLLFIFRPPQQFGYRDPDDNPAPCPGAIEHVLYVRQERTGDRVVTERINAILDEQPADRTGRDELIGYIASFSPHLDRAERGVLADRILARRPQVGALPLRNPHRQVRVHLGDGGVNLLDISHAVEHTTTTNEQGGREQPEKRHSDDAPMVSLEHSAGESERASSFQRTPSYRSSPPRKL